MSASDLTPQEMKTKRTIGIVAIVFLVAFTIPGFLGYLPFWIWLIADLVVAGVANLLLRRVGRRKL